MEGDTQTAMEQSRAHNQAKEVWEGGGKWQLLSKVNDVPVVNRKGLEQNCDGRGALGNNCEQMAMARAQMPVVEPPSERPEPPRLAAGVFSGRHP